MLAPTHSVFGIFLTLIFLAVFGIQWSLHWTIILFAILGAIIPDIDHPHSVIGKIFYPLSKWHERKFGHRTFTHSLLGWAIFSVLFSVLLLFGAWLLGFVWKLYLVSWDLLPRWIGAFSISYFSHLILDMFNRRGVQMFWPEIGRDVIPKNPRFRPESGARVELIIFFILFALMFLALPLSKYGFQSSLRWLLATPGSAIEEFKSQKNHSYLEFKGVFAETKQSVEGEAEILDVQNKRLVVLYNGAVYTLSDELSADILASQVRVKRSNVPIVIEQKIFKDDTRDNLLKQIPAGALVSGVVHLPKGMELKIPLQEGSFRVVEQKGDDLIFNFANKGQIEALALTESFELQQKKDQAEMRNLETEKMKILYQIKTALKTDDYTPLGRDLFVSREKQQEQKFKVAELKNKLEGINVKIEELNIKIRGHKFVFSVEVFLRQ